MIRELRPTDQAVWHVGTDSEQGLILCMRPGLLQQQHWAQNVPDNFNVDPVCLSGAAKLQFEVCSRLNRLALTFVFAKAPLAPSNGGARSLAFESRQ